MMDIVELILIDQTFKRMIKDIKTGKVNMVITKNLARLGRDYIETGRYIETFFPKTKFVILQY